eukprot:scaffold4120_cov400-Prasinococcus_capsulatus_cf.AAC.21
MEMRWRCRASQWVLDRHAEPTPYAVSGRRVWVRLCVGPFAILATYKWRRASVSGKQMQRPAGCGARLTRL